jgi:integrase
MAIEKVGIHRKWLEPIPQKDGKSLPKSEWPDKRNHRWVVRWYGTNGKRFGKIFKTRKEASNYALELQSRVNVGKPDKPKNVTLEEFMDEHKHVMKGQVAYATLRDQMRALTFFKKFIDRPIVIAKIQPRHAEAFIAHRLASGSTTATANKDIRTLRRVFNLAIEPRGHLAEGQNPFAKMKQRKKAQQPIRYVTVEEYRKLMNAAEKTWWKALISIAYGSGLRRDEILNLTWADIDFEKQQIRVSAKRTTHEILVWEPKDHENRTVPMSKESAKLLVDLQAESPESHPYLFVSPERLNQIKERISKGTWRETDELVNNIMRDFGAIRRQANVEKCTIHDFRRSAITNWAQTLPIQVVKQLAGHSNISTTRSYYLAVRAQDMESASKAVNSILATF